MKMKSYKLSIRNSGKTIINYQVQIFRQKLQSLVAESGKLASRNSILKQVRIYYMNAKFKLHGRKT